MRRSPSSSARLAALGLAVALAAGAPASARAEDPLQARREAAYDAAVAALAEHRAVDAAREAWAWLEGAGRDDPRYDRALLLAARALEREGLRFVASLWYLDVAQARRDPERVPAALRGLERVVMGGPHDEATLVDGFLATADLPALPADVRPFVDWLQGRDSARHGLDRWADARFAAIPEASPFHARARYVQAVRRVAARDLDGAAADLRALLDAPAVPDDLRAEIHRSLARLAYEAGRYDDALAHYGVIRDRAPEDPALLLEMAWATFRKGDSRRALGLLMALDAPIYGDLIAPERFLLEALCLRRLCQLDAARVAAERLRARHGEALGELAAGVPPRASEPLRAAARRRGAARQAAAFRASLEREAAWVDGHRRALGDALHGRLAGLLARGLAEARRREDVALGAEVTRVAEELLEADEGVRLILHELSVALLRGRRRPEGPPEAPPVRVAASRDTVVFRFGGEFWTDELDDLVVTVEDRCLR